MKEERVTRSPEISVQRSILELVKGVAQEEGFQLERLKPEYEQYYVSVDHSSGKRCVDGRKPVETFTGSYTGSQLAGGSNGEVGVLRAVTGLNEENAQEVILEVSKKAQRRLGNHNDDRHGEITDERELSLRVDGCGDQDQVALGNLQMYEGFNLDQGTKAERIEWIKNSGGSFPTLTGHHNEKGAGLNLVVETTFDTIKAVPEDKSIFNLDARGMFEFSPRVYQELPEEIKARITEVQFRDQMTSAVVRNYFQTLKALNGPEVIGVRADSLIAIN